MIRIYADGAYNPGFNQGAWAAVVVEDGQKRVFSGVAQRTTNNRMELTAALEGIQGTPVGAEVVVYTDSQYLFGTMTRGWKRSANRDLWERLDEAVGKRSIRWEWIYGNGANSYHREAHSEATKLAGRQRSAVAPQVKPRLGEATVHMVDVSAKPVSQRRATARGAVAMAPATLERIVKGEVAKGDVLTAARLAGVMAAKQTPHLIPLCHPLLLDTVEVDCVPRPEKGIVEVTASVAGSGRTGYEMEALTAAAVAALTIYDMCKAYDPAMKIDLALLRKSGGKSGPVELGEDKS